MPLTPNFLERLIFLTANKGPGPLFDFVAALGFRAVEAALNLGVFEALAENPLTLKELGTRMGASERGLLYLLEALEPLGYVEQVKVKGDGAALYRNTAMTRTWMLNSSPTAIGDLFHYGQDMLKHWSWLEESVRAGKAAKEGDAWYREHPDRWSCYHRGMRAIARLITPELIARVKLPSGARRFIDLGGSHGLYSCRFCQAYPQLTATVLDWAAAQEIAEETIGSEHMKDRVVFRAGDFLTDDLGTGYDAALLCNVARILPVDQLSSLFKKVAQALTPGGQLIIVDQYTEKLPTKFLTANAKLINTELFNITPGNIHHADETMEWLTEAGFAPPRHITLRRSGGQGAIVAKKA